MDLHEDCACMIFQKPQWKCVW